jgi:hypothetical protein
MRALGFDTAPVAENHQGRRRFERQQRREVLLVMELAGPAWQQAQERARANAARHDAAAQANADNKEFADKAKRAREQLKAEEESNSRLFAIDAGLDLAALRAKYPDRGRFLILKAHVRPRLGSRERKTGRHRLCQRAGGADGECAPCPAAGAGAGAARHGAHAGRYGPALRGDPGRRPAPGALDRGRGGGARGAAITPLGKGAGRQTRHNSRAMNTSFLLRRVLPVLLVVGIAAGLFFWKTQAKPVSVVLRSVDRGKVEATVVNTRAGTVEACQRTKLSTIMGGRIEYLGVKEGDKVKKGQLLLKLWNDDQKAQQALAEAQRAMAAQRVKEVCTTAASALREAERQPR